MHSSTSGIRHYLWCMGLFLLAVCLAAFTGCEASRRPKAPQTLPRRIVSLSPGITETMFALGLGDRVVGITRFCRYPPRTARIEKIGDLTDANLEKVVTLKPDLVVLQTEHQKQRRFLRRYGIEILVADFGTLDDICSSFARIGRRCGVADAADSLVMRCDSALQPLSRDRARPKVLLCVGRDAPGSGSVHGVYAAGAGTFYHELIRSAGGKNAFPDPLPQYPRLSLEGLIMLAPDIIVDIAPAMDGYSCSTLVTDWKTASMIPAVRNGRIHCLTADYATVPGPRILLLADDLRRIIGDRESRHAVP